MVRQAHSGQEMDSGRMNGTKYRMDRDDLSEEEKIGYDG